MLVYKVPQVGWILEHSLEICFSIKGHQEINRRPTKNVQLKWEEEPSFFSVLWEPLNLPTHSGVNPKMLASLKQVKLYYLRNI